MFSRNSTWHQYFRVTLTRIRKELINKPPFVSAVCFLSSINHHFGRAGRLGLRRKWGRRGTSEQISPLPPHPVSYFFALTRGLVPFRVILEIRNNSMKGTEASVLEVCYWNEKLWLSGSRRGLFLKTSFRQNFENFISRAPTIPRVSNGLWGHLRACELRVYFCEHEQWSDMSCEQRAL